MSSGAKACGVNRAEVPLLESLMHVFTLVHPLQETIHGPFTGFSLTKLGNGRLCGPIAIRVSSARYGY